MKNILFSRLSVRIFLFICLCSSSAYVLIPIVKNLWREITEAQAQKISLKIPSWAPLVERAQPAVVVITTEAMVERPMMEFPGLPFFMPMEPEVQQGQGSGFIINEDGFFITNEHVVHGAQKIKVKVGLNRREYDAKIIGADEALDIALGQIIAVDKDKKKIKWPFLPLGDSDLLKLGEGVMALGSPLGLVQSVNVGIVSQKHRGGIRPNGRDLFVELIQLQMPINPGNSGGPILDDSGRVVAVSESIMAAGNAIAFGVPINIIKTMLPYLEKGGIEKSFLGIIPIDLTPDIAEKLGLGEEDQGAVIAQVSPGTPAEKAGLVVQDVVLEVDGLKIADSFKLREKTAYRGIGQTVLLKIHRQGKGVLEIKVKLEKRPGQLSAFSKPLQDNALTYTVESFGLELADTSEQTRKELGLGPKNQGAQVVGVTARGAAALADLAPGDIIVKVDNILINRAEQLKDLLDKAPSDSSLLMLRWRGHDQRLIRVKKPSWRQKGRQSE